MLVLEWDGSCWSRGCDRFVGSSMDAMQAMLVSRSLSRTSRRSFPFPQRRLPSLCGPTAFCHTRAFRDGALAVVNSIEGCAAETKTLFRRLHKRVTPNLFVDKVDRCNAQRRSLV